MTTLETDIASAKRTIDREVEALRTMENELDISLTQALDMMQSAKGRVIVTGMGKSGHIGKKIAATLASTGTPSFFVHPAEASHGDFFISVLLFLNIQNVADNFYLAIAE